MRTSLAGILAAALIGCAQPVPHIPSPKPIKNHQQLDHLKYTEGPTYEICKLTESSNKVDKIMAGEKVQTTPFLTTNKEKEKTTLKLDISDGVSSANHLDNSSTYEILLVPIGFDDPIPRLESITTTAQQAFKGVNVHFSYVKKSVQLDVENVERWGKISDTQYENFLKDLQIPYSGIAFIVNSDQNLGSGGKYAIAATERYDGITTVVHEIGHLLSLEDEYTRFYGKDSLNKPDKTPGLFMDLNTLKSEYLEFTSEHGVKAVPTPNTCEGKTVFAFYSQRNIMRGVILDKELGEMLTKGQSPFNPLQIKAMNDYIAKQLKK